MTPEERDRLNKLEGSQERILSDLAEIKKDVKALDRFQVRAGGFMFAFLCIGAFVSWLLANLKSFLGIVGQ